MSTRARILEFIGAHPGSEVGVIAAALGMRRQVVATALSRLKQEGAVHHDTKFAGWSLAGPRASDVPLQTMLRVAARQELVTARELADAVSQLQPAGAAFERIGEMVKAGLLTRRRGGHYSITAAGMDMLPKAQAHGPVMTPYRPPTAPPRRPGAMAFAALPSHYARGPM